MAQRGDSMIATRAFVHVVRLVSAGMIGMVLLLSGSPTLLADDLVIWRDFLRVLRSGGMTDSSRYRPYDPTQRAPLMAALEGMRTTLMWDSCVAQPEVFRVRDEVRCVAPLVFQRDGAIGRGTCSSASDVAILRALPSDDPPAYRDR
jgi:hypothetical protein